MISIEVHQTSGAQISKKSWDTWVKKINTTLKLKPTYTVSVAVVGDTAMRRLNFHYRGKDKVTDVLSFGAGDTVPVSGYLGELIICYPQVIRQAKKFKHSISAETQKLFVHGMLHLLGHDHEIEAEAVVMEALEEKIIRRAV